MFFPHTKKKKKRKEEVNFSSKPAPKKKRVIWKEGRDLEACSDRFAKFLLAANFDCSLPFCTKTISATTNRHHVLLLAFAWISPPHRLVAWAEGRGSFVMSRDRRSAAAARGATTPEFGVSGSRFVHQFVSVLHED